jgi:hypothetical protein
MNLFGINIKKTLALAVVAPLALSGVATQSHAVNINSSAASACVQGGIASQATNISHSSGGVHNNGNTNTIIYCGVPRSPLNSNGEFVVDGQNLPGTGTGCTLFVRKSDGTGGVSKSVFNTDLVFHSRFPLNLSELPASAYVAIFCDLAPGNTVLGITAQQ